MLDRVNRGHDVQILQSAGRRTAACSTTETSAEGSLRAAGVDCGRMDPTLAPGRRIRRAACCSSSSTTGARGMGVGPQQLRARRRRRRRRGGLPVTSAQQPARFQCSHQTLLCGLAIQLHWPVPRSICARQSLCHAGGGAGRLVGAGPAIAWIRGYAGLRTTPSAAGPRARGLG